MTITNHNELPESEHITVRQAYETMKLFASSFEIAMQADTDTGSDEHLHSTTYNAANAYEIGTMLNTYGDYYIDFIDGGDRCDCENERYIGKNNIIIFLLMTPVIWGKPIKKHQ